MVSLPAFAVGTSPERGAEEDPCVAYLKDILFGNLPVYTCEKHKLNRQGTWPKVSCVAEIWR